MGLLETEGLLSELDGAVICGAFAVLIVIWVLKDILQYWKRRS